MDFKLAKTTLQDKKEEKITSSQIKDQIEENSKTFYFSNQNNHKDLIKLTDGLKKDGHSAHLREVRFGLDEKEYLYELHVI